MTRALPILPIISIISIRSLRSLLALLALLALLPLTLPACDPTQVTRVLHRDNCLACHTPLEDGLATGIEDAHPWHPLGCVDCHGGNPRICDGLLGGTPDAPTCDGDWVYDQALAHVDPGDSPRDLSALVAGDLDRVALDWVRFQNPSDLRVVNQTCGRCHVDEAAAVRRSGHALQTGDLAIGRLRAGLQPDITPRFAAADQTDPRPRPDPCTSEAVTRFSPLVMDLGSVAPRTRPSPENTLDQLLVQSCIGCHLQDAGPLATRDGERHLGTHRGAGCAACHSAYAEDGRSQSADPFIPRDVPGHVQSHAMVASPSTQSCVACHHQGARIGLSFQGLREVTPGTAPEHAVVFERELYGLPVGALVRDEDGRNGLDETPADVHFEAGMDCIDCHGAWEVHGDGRIGADRTCANVVTRCEDCHGDREAEADPRLGRHALSRRADGALVLTTRRTHKELAVPQVKPVTSAEPDAPWHGAAHLDVVECSTCHSGWMPSCYGCHVDHDLGQTGRYLTTAQLVPGRPRWATLFSTYEDQTLLWNSRGKLQGSMPAERVFLTLRSGAPEPTPPRFSMAPRSTPGASPSGRVPSFGQRAIDPHTTRRKSPFAACARCHTSAAADNTALLDRTHGFGSDRYLLDHCDVAQDAACIDTSPTTTSALDAVIARDGTPLVNIGHGDSRPLSLDEIDEMRAITVP